ncbi:hypothetical protein ON010_g18442 [Phytophthora cinnamomi]|nr:hypothetical protein ON010_g18442 [Phytophthora cinnamomi]
MGHASLPALCELPRRVSNAEATGASGAQMAISQRHALLVHVQDRASHLRPDSVSSALWALSAGAGASRLRGEGASGLSAQSCSSPTSLGNGSTASQTTPLVNRRAVAGGILVSPNDHRASNGGRRMGPLSAELSSKT